MVYNPKSRLEVFFLNFSSVSGRRTGVILVIEDGSRFLSCWALCFRVSGKVSGLLGAPLTPWP